MEEIKEIEINPGLDLKQPLLRFLSLTDEGVELPFKRMNVCLQCQKSVKHQPFIKTSQFSYCVPCFSKVLPQCSHYQVISHKSVSFTVDGWPISHDLYLLEALEKFGNWKSIKTYMDYFDAKYSLNQLEAHYLRIYAEDENSHIQFLEKPWFSKIKEKGKRPNRGGKLIRNQEHSMEIESDNFFENDLNTNCYNPKRDEFVIQYNEMLEKYICDLEFRDDDSAEITQKKYQLLEAYNQQLENRYQKYRVIFEHKLLDHQLMEKQQKERENHKNKEIAYEMLKPFMKQLNYSQMEEMNQNLAFLLKIQALIQSLRDIRNQNVMSTLEQVVKSFQNSSQIEVGDHNGKPRKRIHKNPEKKSQDRCLQFLELSKNQCLELLKNAKEQKDSFLYKGIRVTNLKKLSADHVEQSN